MIEHKPVRWRLGYERAQVFLVQGRPLDHPRPGLYVPGNGRGIMAAGLAAEARLMGGAEIERELRGYSSLLEGSAYLTGPGRLAELGIECIAHGIITRETGATPRAGVPQRAFGNGLRMLVEAGIRVVVTGVVGLRVERANHQQAGIDMARVIAAQIRQTRLREILVATLHHDVLTACRAELRELGAIPIDEAPPAALEG